MALHACTCMNIVILSLFFHFQFVVLGKVGCHLDRHENIGRGHIGLNGFRLMVNDPRFDNIPLVLETPAFVDDSKEVRMLYSLIKV